MRRTGVAIATAFGAGYAPVAPGTFGSAVGILWVLGFRGMSMPTQVGALALLILAGVWAADVARVHFGKEDPGAVVIDEVAGQVVAVFLLDVGAAGLFAGFILFRLFDILKPWPIRRLESLHGGIGIMADDLLAGVFAWVCLRAGLAWLPGGL